MGDPRTLARDQRASDRISAEDTDSAVRRDAAAARRRAGDQGGGDAGNASHRASPGRTAGSTIMLPGEVLSVVMVAAVCGLLMAGYPIALTLGGVSFGFALLGHALGVMD